MASATSTGQSRLPFKRFGHQLAAKHKHKRTHSEDQPHCQQISYNKLVRLEMRSRQGHRGPLQYEPSGDTVQTTRVPSSRPQAESDPEVILSHNKPLVSPLRETASRDEDSGINATWPKLTTTRNTSDDNLAQAKQSRVGSSSVLETTTTTPPPAGRSLLSLSTFLASASSSPARPFRCSGQRDRHKPHVIKPTTINQQGNCYYLFNYYSKLHLTSPRVTTNLRGPLILLITALACLLWSLSGVPAPCRAYQLSNNLIANNLPPKFVQSSSGGGGGNGGQQSMSSASSSASSSQGGTNSEIVVRVKEGPQSIGRLIYTLRGEDPDDDPLTFGGLGTMATCCASRMCPEIRQTFICAKSWTAKRPSRTRLSSRSRTASWAKAIG